MANSFIVQYAVQMGIASLGLGGPIGAFVAFLAEKFLGVLLDRGLIKLDISMDGWAEARKDPKWKDAAEKAFNRATARVYTEEEKDAIRKEYLAALSNYATFGNGLSDH